ncbi:TonB-dependent receptor [Parabacteroides sp. Marseille-P3160]|uniref:SusC/RagA family TonB-linked outer membrane protein n=1 Tax=Parabacteroides sp. Marseille-P3160 TaxID=1917887 RepID=UPI0009BB8B75|nr:TonB-dependent receptor [Parabacteroides sp. Marseille-P3160]
MMLKKCKKEQCLPLRQKLLLGRIHIKWILPLCILTFLSLSAFSVKAEIIPVLEKQQGGATVKVKGKVSDEGGDPLPGATVQIKGSTRGVITDENGVFEFDDVPLNATLTVSFIGMQPLEINYKGQKQLDIVLQYKVDELQEVSVVAFGRQKKESVLASISTVKPTELKIPSSNLTTAFAGRVAGLISYQQSGEPGKDNASFFIRGITTFGAESKKDPLILIDGVELTTEDLSRLNTDDISSFSIMKDATATALYGARGANGVISVTTKEGKEGKVQVNVRLENSFSSPTRKIDIADPVTFMKMHNEAVKTRDPLGIPIYSQEKIIMTERGLYPDIFPANDWYKTMFDDVTINQRANLSLSGGGTVARYYVAANITQDNGNMKVDSRNNFNSNISLTKYNVRSNVNVNVTKTTELILRMNAAFDEYTGPIDGGSAMYQKVMQANPVFFKPYYEPDEQFAYAKHILFGNFGNAGYINPYAESLKGYRDYSKNQMLTQFEVKQDLSMITEGLTARAMVNMNRYSEYTVDRQYFPFYYDIQSYDLMTNTYKLQRLNPTRGTEYINYIPGQRYINTTFYLEAAAEYNKQINRVHNLNGLLVYTMRNEKKGIADNLQLSLPSRNMGVSGRLAYNFDSRYFGEFNFGYNGSERFSKNRRFGFFPSVGAAWMLSNETFFKPIKKYVTQFKLKATYGLVGNDAIGNEYDRFYYLSEVNMNAGRLVNWGTQLNYNPLGISINRYANDKIGWETAYKTNIGVEVALSNGMSLNADLFKERRKNILLTRVIPATMGIIPDVKANLGEAEGKGIDLEFNYEKIVNNDLWLTGRGTFTYATSKAIEWEEPDYSETPWLSRVGKSLAQNWGYIAERLFVDDLEVANSPTQFGTYQAGDIKYRDINGDGKISALDKVPIGYPTTPEINYGFGLSVGYKDIDASFFFQGSGRQSFWIDLKKTTPFLDGNSGIVGEDDGLIGQNAIIQAFADSYWSEDNPNPYALWPRLANYEIANNRETSTWFMQDATFLRLKSVEVGYTLPKTLTRKFFVQNLRVYLSGTNLLCWSRFKLWDPEMAGNGLGYPVQRVFNIGLTIGL